MIMVEWIIALFAVGVILMIAEILLPTHGILGAGGVLACLAGLVLCFVWSVWLGLGVFVGGVVAAPLIGAWWIRIWPRTPMGRRIVLPPAETRPEPLPVQIGQRGIAISDLRPTGVCEFDGRRVEATSEIGIISAGQVVSVVNVDGRRPVVRVGAESQRPSIPV